MWHLAAKQLRTIFIFGLTKASVNCDCGFWWTPRLRAGHWTLWLVIKRRTESVKTCLNKCLTVLQPHCNKWLTVLQHIACLFLLFQATNSFCMWSTLWIYICLWLRETGTQDSNTQRWCVVGKALVCCWKSVCFFAGDQGSTGECEEWCFLWKACREGLDGYESTIHK